MKSAVAITLVICLVGSALPLAAQEQIATDRPLARAVAREAARFATAAERQPGDAEWSRVRELDSGADLAVTVKGSRPAQRYFLAADESSLTVLNAAGPGISTAVKQVLVDTATDHPIDFVLAQQDKTFLLAGNVRLTREGIFAGDQKVAALEEIVVHMARNSIAEISVRARRVGRSTGWGAAIGGSAGLVAGLLAGARHCRTHTCDSFPPIAFGMMFGTFAGGIGSGLGAVVGAARGKIEKVIYRSSP